MINALGYQDFYRGRCGQAGGTSAGTSSPPATTTQSGSGGNVGNASFSYSSSVEVNFSSQGMQMAYSSKTEFSVTYSQTAEISRPAPAQSMQSPDTSAANIVGFIDERLKALKASGASAEEMQKALDDGLSGYQAGRDQAVDILKGYGLYDGPIKAGVEKTTELVQKGVEELAKKYLGAPATDAVAAEAAAAAAVVPAIPATPAPSNTGTTTTPTNTSPVDDADEDDAQVRIPSVSRYRAKLYNEDKLDLTVQTRDGDTVTISIGALQSLRVNGADWEGMTGFAGLQGDGSLSTLKGFYSESSLFEVDGELDDAEKAALDDLVGSIMDLADSFYSGDMTAALDKALQLQLDPTELSSMSLEMTQTRYMRASAATYRDIAGVGGSVAPAARHHGKEREHGLAGLGEYVRNLRNLGERATNLKNPMDFINEMFSAAFAQRDALQSRSPMSLERMDSLHRDLVNGALAPAPAAQEAA